MKIGIVYFDDCGTFKNGETEKANSIISYLRKQGHQLTLISTFAWKKHPLRLFLKIAKASKKVDCFIIVLSVNGTKVVSRCLFSVLRYKKPVYYAMVGIGTLRNELTSKMGMEEITAYFHDEKLWKRSRDRFSKTFAKFKKVFVECETLKRLYEFSYDADNVAVLQNFRNCLPIRKKTKASNVVRFVFFARVCLEKGINDLIEAAKQLNSYGYSDRFEIGVCGSLADDYAKLCIGQLPHNVHYLGAISESKQEFLENYDCLVFPTKHLEGIPGTIVEAYQSGLPVISSNFSFAQDIIEDGKTGWVYDFGSKDGLIEKMKNVIDHPEMIHAASVSAFEKAKEYTEEVSTIPLKAIFES